MELEPITTDPKENRRLIYRLGFRYHYLIWRAVGYWPLPTDWKPIYYTYSFALNFSTYIVFNVFIWLSLPQAENINEIVEIIVPTITTVVISTQGMLVAWNKDKITRLIRLGNKLLQAAIDDDPASIERFNTSRKISYQVLLFIAPFTQLTIFTRLLQTAFFSPVRRLMWITWMPFDWRHASTPLYVATVIFHYVVTAYLGFLHSSVALYTLQLYGTLSAFLNVMADRVLKLGNTPGEDKAETMRKLINSVEYHKLCLKYYKLLNDAFSIHYFVQFIASGLVICAIAFQLSVVQPSETSKFIFFVLYMCIMGVMLLIPCIYGSLLKYDGAKITMNTYKSNWLVQSQQYKAAMNFLVHCSQIPIEMYTYKRWFIIHLPTFVTIGRAAYSLMSCLRGM